MTLLELIVLLIVAGICGSVAQSLVGYSRGGCLVSMFLGFIGAMLGSWIAHRLGIHEILSIKIGDQQFPVVFSVIGASLFVALLSLVSRRPTV